MRAPAEAGTAKEKPRRLRGFSYALRLAHPTASFEGDDDYDGRSAALRRLRQSGRRRQGQPLRLGAKRGGGSEQDQEREPNCKAVHASVTLRCWIKRTRSRFDRRGGLHLT